MEVRSSGEVVILKMEKKQWGPLEKWKFEIIPNLSFKNIKKCTKSVIRTYTSEIILEMRFPIASQKNQYATNTSNNMNVERYPWAIKQYATPHTHQRNPLPIYTLSFLTLFRDTHYKSKSANM